MTWIQTYTGHRVDPADVKPEDVRLAERSERMAELIGTKLQPVATSPTPPTVKEAPQKNNREYPPLFNELNTLLNRLGASLDSIQEILSRVEL